MIWCFLKVLLTDFWIFSFFFGISKTFGNSNDCFLKATCRDPKTVMGGGFFFRQGFCVEAGYTPEFTNMTGRNITIFNRRYIFSFQGGSSFDVSEDWPLPQWPMGGCRRFSPEKMPDFARKREDYCSIHFSIGSKIKWVGVVAMILSYYCWWKKSCTSLAHYIVGLHTSHVIVWNFWTINSIKYKVCVRKSRTHQVVKPWQPSDIG